MHSRATIFHKIASGLCIGKNCKEYFTEKKANFTENILPLVYFAFNNRKIHYNFGVSKEIKQLIKFKKY